MTILKFTRRRTLSRYADDKAVEDFAKVCEQQRLTRTDQIAAQLAKPDIDIAELARLLGQHE